MAYKIDNHWLDGAERVPTAHTSGKIVPSLIVVHESVSRLGRRQLVKYLERNERRVSYHLVIERDGEVVQMAPLDARCHHAGRSSWRGRKWCNSYSIGIALVGPGPLKGSEDTARSYFGETYTRDDGIIRRAGPYHGSTDLWLDYTTAQRAALEDVVRAIRRAYPGIDIAGHYHVSPGRKFDPSPALDIQSLGGPLVPSEGDMMVTQAEPSRAIVAKGSSTYKAAGRAKATAAVVATGAGAAEVVKELGTASQGASTVKQLIDTTASLAASYGLVTLAAVGVGAVLLFQWIQERRVQEHEAGRYETEGEA